MDEPIYIKPTLLSIIIEKKKDFNYERYGLRENKNNMEFENFCELVSSYYSFTNSNYKAESFFRHPQCQDKFREMNGLDKEQAADHIISTAVFREIIKFPMESSSVPNYTFDYWASIRTTMNQCWNFQTLSKKENSKKGSVELKICTFLKEDKLDDLKKNFSCTNYIKNIHSTFCNALKNGKTFFNQAENIAKKINAFFSIFGLPTLEFHKKFNNSHISCITTKENKKCKLCQYCENSSKKWRLKYSVIYQSGEMLERRVLHELSMKIFYDGIFYTEQEKLKVTKDLKANTLWALYLEVNSQKNKYQIIYSKFWDLARNYCIKKANKLKKDNLIEFFKTNSDFPTEIKNCINLFLNGGTLKDFVENLNNLQLNLIQIKWGGEGNSRFKTWIENEKTYLVQYGKKLMTITYVNDEGDSKTDVYNLSDKEIEDHFSNRSE